MDRHSRVYSLNYLTKDETLECFHRATGARVRAMSNFMKLPIPACLSWLLLVVELNAVEQFDRTARALIPKLSRSCGRSGLPADCAPLVVISSILASGRFYWRR